MIPAELFSVSGNERDLTAYLKDKLGGEPDNLGNLIVTQNGTGKKIAVCCGIDEPGIFVTDVSGGKIHFAVIGKMEVADLINRTLVFKDGTNGIVCCETPVDKAKVSDLFIKADKNVSVGDIARFTTEPLNDGERMVSNTVRRDFGIEAVLKLYECFKDTDYNMVYIFSSLYGVGKKGLNAAFLEHAPDFAVIADTICDDGKNIKCGCGPVVKITEGSYTAPSVLHEFARERKTAMVALKEAEIRGENSCAFGTISGYVSIPVKKLSGGIFEGVLSDIDKTVSFIKDFVAKQQIM